MGADYRWPKGQLKTVRFFGEAVEEDDAERKGHSEAALGAEGIRIGAEGSSEGGGRCRVKYS